MAFLWDDVPGYAVGIENARKTVELLVPFWTDGLGEAHAPLLLERLQALGLAKGVKAVEVDNWTDTLLVIEEGTEALVALIVLE